MIVVGVRLGYTLAHCIVLRYSPFWVGFWFVAAPFDNNKTLLHIQVEAWVTEPEKATAKIANQFYFTFAATATDDKPIRNVLPSNIEEARQMVWRMQADKEQQSS